MENGKTECAECGVELYKNSAAVTLVDTNEEDNLYFCCRQCAEIQDVL